MIRLLLLVAPLLLLSVSCSSSSVVFGFLPDYRFDGAELDHITSYVTHLCLFSSEADPQTGKLIARLPSQDKLALLESYRASKKIKLFLAFGGAGRSDFFNALSSSQAVLKVFLAELESFMRTELSFFDGIELNWMYPNSQLQMNTLKTITNFLQANLGLQVSMAVPPDRNFAVHVSKIGFDFVHLMAYQAAIGADSFNTVQALVQSIAPGTSRIYNWVRLSFYSLKNIL
jgi:hypothetical protein